ncbi:multidrug effflux MFS transporter [Xanthobacter aminoxidans]|uniref:Bcr/CflA family efflux transporter n=1 Tax=Xanthobacter aminoxidans TaxID=186280 RepID=A0ABW6ZQE3_9HYPH
MRAPSPAGTTAAPLMTEREVSIIGGMMVMLGPVSLSLYTPALPTLVEVFGASIATVKLTLTVFFFGFAVSQLVCGPLSDAYGRRPVALGFFGIYLSGALVAMLAPTIGWLVAGRILQGIGAAAGIALSRALVRDQYTGQASARVMNLIGTILAIGPAVSPTIGGLLLGTFGWHSVFVAMTVFGLSLMLVLVLRVPETNRTPDRRLAAPRAVARSYRRLLSNRSFMRAALTAGCALGGIYTLAAAVPFLLIDRVGLSPTGFGLAMMMQTGAFMLGTLIVRPLLNRYKAQQLILPGLLLVLTGAAIMAVGTHVVGLSTLSVMLPISFWACGCALLLPGCTTNALAGFGSIAGAASALTGFVQIGSGFVGTSLSALLPSPLIAMTMLVPVMAVAALVVHLALAPRRTDEPAPVEVEPQAPDIELAADPLGLVGAAGDEIEAGTYRHAS